MPAPRPARSRLARFLRDPRGTVSAEAVIVLPLVLLTLMITVVFADMFRARATSQKAAYSVADTLSRLTDPVEGAYIDGLNDVYAFLSRARQTTWLRVSSIGWSNANSSYVVIWSHDATGGPGLTTPELLQHYTQRLPTMPAGETVIMIEANMNYRPLVVGFFQPLQFTTMIVTRPRFTPQLRFDTGEEIIFQHESSGFCDDDDGGSVGPLCGA
jgi:Flp pilus assembly protein TadG